MSGRADRDPPPSTSPTSTRLEAPAADPVGTPGEVAPPPTSALESGRAPAPDLRPAPDPVATLLAPLAGHPLADLLAARAPDTTEHLFALRTTLDPRDTTDDHRATADLIRLGHERAYARMHEGLRLGSGREILCFAGLPAGRAVFMGFRRFFARRPGIVPGDIVYDYDVSDLFHQFVARSHRPTFYDAIDLPGFDDLVGRLVVQWPRPEMIRLRRAAHPDLRLVAPVS